MKPAKDMTPAEVIEALIADDLRSKVRDIFAKWHGRIEKDAMQIRSAGPVEWRRMELQAAEEIIETIAANPQS